MEGKFVLLHVDTNDMTGHFGRNQSVMSVLSAAQDLSESSEGIDKLAKGVWLLDLQKAVPFLCRICDAANSTGVPYRLLFLEQEPEWITYGEWK
jgi:hypothetical protein